MSAPLPQIARLDADLQMLALKRQATARFRAGELAEQRHQLLDLDADSLPFPGAVYGTYLNFGGAS
jgi:hypothetical protein